MKAETLLFNLPKTFLEFGAFLGIIIFYHYFTIQSCHVHFIVSLQGGELRSKPTLATLLYCQFHAMFISLCLIAGW